MDGTIVGKNLLLMKQRSEEKGGLNYFLLQDNVIWERYDVTHLETDVGMIYDNFNGRIQRFCKTEELNKDSQYTEFAKAKIHFVYMDGTIKINLKLGKDELGTEAIMNLGETFKIMFNQKHHELGLEEMVRVNKSKAIKRL